MPSRRTLLRGMGAATLASWALPGLSFAAAPADRRLVLVLLRGGLDGLAAVPPHGEGDYRKARGALALDDVVDLDGRFGLHPSLEPLRALWTAGELGVVHAVGNPYLDRSHFDAQNCLENGTDVPFGQKTGWLNRALASLGADDPALAVGRTVPLVLRGEAPVTSADPLRTWRPDDDFLDEVADLYGADPALGPALEAAVHAQQMLAGHRPPGTRRRSGPQELQRITEVLGGVLASSEGPRVAVVDVGGWDTHARQDGVLSRMLEGLAGGIVTLKEATGPAWSDTLVVVVTEFGRTVAANGTGGTDHGTGSAVLLAGGAAAGGRVHGTWPGLKDLHEDRDLKPVTDVRAVLGGVLRDHLGVDEAALATRVFPGGSPVPLEGLVRA